jgi:hypothetical protein
MRRRFLLVTTLNCGPARATTNLAPEASFRQAYLALGTTIAGQEIDWKIGVWDTIIGYEGLTSSPTIPTTPTPTALPLSRLLTRAFRPTYKVNDEISLQAGVADDSFSNGAGGATPGYYAAINGAAGCWTGWWSRCIIRPYHGCSCVDRARQFRTDERCDTHRRRYEHSQPWWWFC